MAVSEVVRARINADLKREASDILAQMGLSVSDAIRMMLVRVVAERSLPFEVRVPNDATEQAMVASQRGEVARFESVEALMADLNDEK
ncbi:MAG: type II toxin-antitoxin system RelB/DinJ family antitoxin [Zymomonas sp.]|nr:MAG: type II toxin-antitoxin system RelB/DinJ family antitoxin [Zymomonas sp.]